jgi:hypothetical protein
MNFLETLEDRIAPATLLNPTTLIYTDVDGDAVTVKVSKGDLTGAFTTATVNTGITDAEQLLKLDLLGSEFKGATVTITAVPTGEGGDGFVNVGFINADGTDLGKVKVDGDLAKIVVGSGTKTAISSLEVQSMGVYGDLTGAMDTDSVFKGDVATLKVKGDLDRAYLNVQGDLKTLSVSGSLIGGSFNDDGSIRVSGSLSKAVIGGDVVGGGASFTGYIAADDIGSVSVVGSVLGGFASSSGYIGAASKISVGGDVVGGSVMNTMNTGVIGGKSVFVKGSLYGGAGERSGLVVALADATVSIGRDVYGGVGTASGAIFSDASDIKSISIGGDLRGAGGDFSGAVVAGDIKSGVTVKGSVFGSTGTFSGFIVGDAIKKVSIDGSIIGQSGFTMDPSGGIYAEVTLGSVAIKGSVDGSYGRSLIVAGGTIGDESATIGKVTIGGGVSNLDILAGYHIKDTGVFEGYNGDASVASVKVGGNWSSSNITAGVETNSTSLGFSQAATSIIAGSASNVKAWVGSVSIGGQASGMPGSIFTCGIVAEQQDGLSSIKVGKKSFTFNLPSDVVPIGSTFYSVNGKFNFLAYMEA